jgi:hypothetical protein
MFELLGVFLIGCSTGAFIAMFINSSRFRDWRVRRQQAKWNKSKTWFRG